MGYKKIMIDGHNDTMMHLIDEKTWLPVKDIGKATDLHIDMKKLKAGGLNTPIFAAYTPGYYKNTAKSLSRTLALLNALYFTERKNKNEFKIVSDVEDIEKTFERGKIAAIPAIEGAYGIDSDNYYELLKQFKDIGVKILGFNWNYSNNLGEGAAEIYEKEGKISEGGITELGIRVLKEMKELGIGIDVSHMNERTFWGVVENVNNPIIATHSNAYSLTGHRRNLKDDQLKAIANSNGLVGAVLCPAFITEGKVPHLEHYLNHIDYMVGLIGIDHVGIGSDFDGAELPIDMKDSSQMHKIIDGLLLRDYSNSDIDKIIGENFLRVFRELEKNADKRKLSDIEVEMNISMGDNVSKDKNIEIRLSEPANIRIILDGIELITESDIMNMDYKLDFKNDEIFHILTVEVEKGNAISRITNIIHI